MIGNVLRSVNTKVGRIVISIILGIGLASIFRRVCNSRDCLVFEAPPLQDIVENTFKYNGKCIRFKENPIPCSKDKKTVDFA